jgi:hypothetical protein
MLSVLLTNAKKRGLLVATVEVEENAKIGRPTLEASRAKMLGQLVAAGPTGLVAREITLPLDRMVDGKRDFVRGSERLRVAPQNFRALHDLADLGYAQLVEEKEMISRPDFVEDSSDPFAKLAANINRTRERGPSRILERFTVTIHGLNSHWTQQ